MITILLPTAKRPELLVTALRSVAEQTAVKEIAEVIVSESAGDVRSREVCNQFPSLPIRYIFRDPQMLMTPHFSSLKSATWAGEFTVMLHDDDWWTPDFIASGLEALRSHPQASTYSCASYHARGEDITWSSDPNDLFRFAANFPADEELWEMNGQDVFLACLFGTPAQYSTIMGRAKPFRDSAVIYETGNKWDVDRMFMFELSKHGTVLYSPKPHAYYRWHAQQLTESLATEYRNKQMVQTTEWMFAGSAETWEQVGTRFYERIRRCPAEDVDGFNHRLLMPWLLPTMAGHMDPTSNLVKFYKTILRRQKVERRMKALLPSALTEKAKDFRNEMRRRFKK